MPTYDYACERCGGFDALRAIGERDAPLRCPLCGSAATRVLAAPRLALLADGTRGALARNERARHEPQRSSEYQTLRHPSGCGCCRAGAGGSTTRRAANGNKAFPSKRPWMISH